MTGHTKFPTRVEAIEAALAQLQDADHRALRFSADERTRGAVMMCALEVAFGHRHVSTPGMFLAVRYGHGHNTTDRLLWGGIAVDFFGVRNPITLRWPELVTAWAKTDHAHGEPGGTLRAM